MAARTSAKRREGWSDKTSLIGMMLYGVGWCPEVGPAGGGGGAVVGRGVWRLIWTFGSLIGEEREQEGSGELAFGLRIRERERERALLDLKWGGA